MPSVYYNRTRPPHRVKVRKDRCCGICGLLIKVGEYADYFSWWSYTGARQEWHCMKCVEPDKEG